MDDTPSELHPAIVQLVEQIGQLPYIKTIRLFGSRTRGDNHPRSDVDLAIECPDASFQDWQVVLDLLALVNWVGRLAVAICKSADHTSIPASAFG